MKLHSFSLFFEQNNFMFILWLLVVVGSSDSD